jgi:anti-anti-sigma factor
MVLLRVMRPGSGRLFRLFGELDASSVGELDTVLRLASGGGDVVLDLADLAFIDSSGIKRFVEIARELGTRGSLTLLSPRPGVARVLELTRTAEALPNLVVFRTHDPSLGCDEPRRARPVRPQPPTTSISIEPAVIRLDTGPAVPTSSATTRSPVARPQQSDGSAGDADASVGKSGVAQPQQSDGSAKDWDLPFIWLG